MRGLRSMRSMVLVLIALSMFIVPIFADSSDYKSKEVIIKEILAFSKESFLKAPKQEGKFATGLSASFETVYTVYPKVTDQVRDKLIAEALVDIETILDMYTNEELSLGFEDYKTTIKGASFKWIPLYQEPQSVILAYSTHSIESNFRGAIARNKTKIKEEKRKEELELYDKSRTEGMPSTWAKEDVESAIKSGYVPLKLQSKYQDPISREEFAELFVKTIFKEFNNSSDKLGSLYKKTWEFEELDAKSFLSKVSTNQVFADTKNDYVKVANILGIINGSSDGIFSPEAEVTRESAAVMLTNYYHTLIYTYASDAEDELEDLSHVSSWAKEGVIRAYNDRLIKAVTPFIGKDVYGQKEVQVIQMGRFQAKDTLSREEAIIIINDIQKTRVNKSNIIARGYMPLTMDSIMSGVDIEKDKVKYKRSNYDNKYISMSKLGSVFYKVKTSYLTKYKSEELDAIFIMAQGVNQYENHPMYRTESIDKVLRGEETFYDYGFFTIEHNKSGYLVVASKTSPVYMRRGSYLKDGALTKIKVKNAKTFAYNTIYDEKTDEASIKVANDILRKVVKDTMSESAKIEAITKALKNHGKYWSTALYSDPNSGYHNYQHEYTALVEKLANYSGWYNAYELLFELAGLETNPKHGTIAYESDFKNKGTLTGKIAVKAEGEWKLIDFLPESYVIPKSAKEIEEENNKKALNNISRALSINKLNVESIMKAAVENPSIRVSLKQQIEGERSQFKHFELVYPQTESEKDVWRERGYRFVDQNAKTDSNGQLLFKDIYEKE